MKRLSNPVIPGYTPKSERAKEVTLTFEPCCICGKAITQGHYGRWGNGGTCSKKCELIKESGNERQSQVVRRPVPGPGDEPGEGGD